MARYAIGDVHGGAKTLRALLGRVGIRPGDRLFFLGDFIDHGPDSRGVLDTVINLKSAGFRVSAIRGNHEDMLLRTLSEAHDAWSPHWLESMGEKTLESFEIGGVGELPEQYVNFLKSLPLLVLEDDYLFVHAGLAFNAQDPIRDSSEAMMLWHGSGLPDRKVLGGRVAATGHKFYPLRQIESSLASDCILLDNGAYTAGKVPEHGNLVALDLDRKKLFVQPWVD